MRALSAHELHHGRGQFGRSAFAVALEPLAPGTCDLLVGARSSVSTALDASTWVRGAKFK
jgi:hypothetical protein